MSAETVIDALQAQHRAIAGVKQAPDQRPSSINTADMPLVLVRPMAATWDVAAIGQRFVVRDYEVACFVGPVAQGQGADEVWQRAMNLLDLFGTLYTLASLAGTLGVTAIMGAVDTGLSGTLEWAGVAYTGFTYTVKIKEKAT